MFRFLLCRELQRRPRPAQLLAIQYFLQPTLLDDERLLCPENQTAPLARVPVRLPCLDVSSQAFPFPGSVYLRLPRCGVSLVADHAASTLVANLDGHSSEVSDERCGEASTHLMRTLLSRPIFFSGSRSGGASGM